MKKFFWRIIVFFLIIFLPYFTFASSRSWPFDQGSNYLYDSSKIEVISSYAQLKSAQPIWWNTSYKYRRQITITNNSSSTLPSGYSVKIVLDHRSLVNEGKSLASGDDLRIIYFNGTTNLELDRVNETSFNSPATEIWFKTQASIPPSSSDSNYFLYYGNPSASDPAQNKENVYLFFDDFESGNLNKWTVQIDEVWSVASDKSYSGDRSLKIKNNINDTHKWITANGINESNLYFESYWRMKKSAKLDIAQGVRCSSSLPINQYETNLEGSDGWDIAKLIDGNWTEITENTGTPVNNRWIKITTIIFGTKMKVLKDDSVLIDWTDVGEELNSGTIGFRAWKARRGARWWIDDVKVRKYIDPEPSLALGEEKTNYPTDKPTIRPNESNYQTYSALSEFLTQEEVNGGSIRYQITNEGEKTDPTWYYFDGTNWTIATNKDQSNDAQTINDHLQEFVEQIGEGNFSFKAILISDGSQFVRLDEVTLDYQFNYISISIEETYNRDGSLGEGICDFKEVDPVDSPFFIGTSNSPAPYAIKLKIISTNDWFLYVKGEGDFTDGINSIPISQLSWSPSGADSWTEMSLSDVLVNSGSENYPAGEEFTYDYKLEINWENPPGNYTANILYTAIIP